MRPLRNLSATAAVGMLLATALFSRFCGPALAEDAPLTRPLLTIGGSINGADNAAPVSFDRASLEALGMESIETATPWYNGKVKFEGVPMQKLLDTVKAKGTNVVAIALDDYVSTIPIEDFAKYHVLLALKRDGNYMAVRDKGPLFIVYPYDSSPELQTQKFYSRSAWQVKRIDVK